MTEQEYLAKRNAVCKEIARCSFEAYNYYKGGMDELVYEAGLMVELQLNQKIVARQQEFPIYYKDIASEVKRKMDLVVCDEHVGNIVLELKALERVGEQQRYQLWSYMKLMNMHLGMLINFSSKGVYYECYELMKETGMCERF